MSEKVQVGSAVPSWVDYIQADGQIVAQRTVTYPSGALWGFNNWGSFNWTASSPTVTWAYFTLDHLNSVAVIADSSGTVTQRLSFDPWGKQRNPNGTDAACGTITPNITRGFTNQEQMPAECLVNLNARIYDPSIGRFMAPDTVIPNPMDGQAYNRFSYVNNNPLSFTDPTGLTPSFSLRGGASLSFGGGYTMYPGPHEAESGELYQPYMTISIIPSVSFNSVPGQQTTSAANVTILGTPGNVGQNGDSIGNEILFDTAPPPLLAANPGVLPFFANNAQGTNDILSQLTQEANGKKRTSTSAQNSQEQGAYYNLFGSYGSYPSGGVVPGQLGGTNSLLSSILNSASNSIANYANSPQGQTLINNLNSFSQATNTLANETFGAAVTVAGGSLLTGNPATIAAGEEVSVDLVAGGGVFATASKLSALASGFLQSEQNGSPNQLYHAIGNEALKPEPEPPE